MVEYSKVSVGRGTDAPFELVGAPWVDGHKLADYLNPRRIPGVHFTAAEFTPASSPYAGQLCRGVRITLTDRDVLDSPLLGVELMSALLKPFPADYKLDRTDALVANARVMEAVKAGRDPHVIADEWRKDVRKFMKRRQKFLLY
jgi:uncharacterized protein YbbC (DUF1343 family)